MPVVDASFRNESRNLNWMFLRKALQAHEAEGKPAKFVFLKLKISIASSVG
jgi:hypothetical protein